MGKPVHRPSVSDAVAKMPEKFKMAKNPSLIAETDFTGFSSAKTDSRPLGEILTSIKDHVALIILQSGDCTRDIVSSAVEVLSENGNLCIVTDHASTGFPVDQSFLLSLKELHPRNRVVAWHGISRLFSSIIWLSKAAAPGNYAFDLDAVRVPSKYPGKRSSRTGKLSGNPLGKNPSDSWRYCCGTCHAVSGMGFCDFKRVVRALCPVGGRVLAQHSTVVDSQITSSLSDLKRDIVLIGLKK